MLLRSAQQAQGEIVTPRELPKEVVVATTVPPVASGGPLRTHERDVILQALADTNGHLQQAAARLGIHQATLYRKLKRYGLSPKTGDLALALGRKVR